MARFDIALAQFHLCQNQWSRYLYQMDEHHHFVYISVEHLQHIWWCIRLWLGLQLWDDVIVLRDVLCRWEFVHQHWDLQKQDRHGYRQDQSWTALFLCLAVSWLISFHIPTLQYLFLWHQPHMFLFWQLREHIRLERHVHQDWRLIIH